VVDQTLDTMNTIEKRDFIHSYLHKASENTINEFYEKLLNEEALKAKLESRAHKSENDIQVGRVLTRTEIEERTARCGRR
jgi:hypothetical protein